MTLFGPDVSRWQGVVDWRRVDATAAFGWSKCTEGTFYKFPGWLRHKRDLAARAEATGLVPGAYLFLAHGNGGRQADYFADWAGNMDGFAIAVDVEPREPDSHPTMADARACVARLRARYPGHPIGGYIPHWYWGSHDTTFVDYLWASNYVSGGPASPQTLYDRVSPAQWAGYGGSRPALLQFTDKAVIGGIDGPCDCSAFRGSAGELRTLLLGRRKGAPVTLRRKWIPSPNHEPRREKVRLIVLHTTEGAQSIESLGAFFANPASQVSSHVGIDDTPGVVGAYVRRERAAWTAAGANQAGVHGEFCTPSGAAANWTRATWLGQHGQMLENAAAWIREEAAHYGIPIHELSMREAQGGAAGVCQHSDLGAWGGGHFDCGPGFPMDHVIALARGQAPVKTSELELEEMGYLAFDDGGSATVVIPNYAADGDHRLRLGCSRTCSVEVDFKQGKTQLDLSWDAGAQGLKIPKDAKFGAVRLVGDPPSNGAQVAVTISD